MKAFFDIVREKFGPLSSSQVDGFNVLIGTVNGLTVRHQAYVLATAWHETAKTMQPIREKGSDKYLSRYEGRKDLGNTIKGDGVRFCGRGYAQITGRRNYALFANLLGVDIVANPDLALTPAVAAKIILIGMRDGYFTKKSMGHYITFKDMRRVVNGTDKADLIAGYAETFLKGLLAVQERPAVASKPVSTPEPPKPAPVVPDAPVAPEKPSLQKVMVWLVAAITAAVAAYFGFGG